ncbi:glycosyltransferase family 2 protein [uncultured Cellulomonas sp.]|uniref:glycosyltransferase family 2 protein n=1 Tax=uncultured Cellulomonas sp. TaxID=189682 RepID=UPI002603F271|nr:glycosyltransferase [uncultured Cellulomonas sp.]
MSDRRTVSVVIPSYRRPDRLPPLIEAFGRTSADQIVVVLDGPHPGAVDALRALGVDRLTILELPQNVGVARARVAGVEAATGDVVLVADDDVMPGADDVVEAHRRFHETTPRGVLVGYMPVAEPARPGPDDAPTRLYAREYEGAARRWEADPGSVLGGLWGGAVSIDTGLFREAEALLPSIRMDYSEDLDLGLRLEQLGATARFDRSVASTHLHRRGWDAFLRESAARGLAAHQLEQRWGRLPVHVAALVQGAGVQGRVADVLARAPRAATTVPLTVAYRLTGRLGASGPQEAVCRLARRLVAGRTYRSARRGAAPIAAQPAA